MPDNVTTAGSLAFSLGGSMVGGRVGLLFGPLGSLAGAVGGAVAGSKYGSQVTQRVCDAAAQNSAGDFCSACAPSPPPHNTRQRFNEAVRTAAEHAGNWAETSKQNIFGRLGCAETEDVHDEGCGETTEVPTNPNVAKEAPIPQQHSSSSGTLNSTVSSVSSQLNQVAHLTDERLQQIKSSMAGSLQGVTTTLNNTKSRWLRHWQQTNEPTETETDNQLYQAADNQAVEDVQSWVQSVQENSEVNAKDKDPSHQEQADSTTVAEQQEWEQVEGEFIMPEEWRPHLLDLVDMGFDESQACKQLHHCQGNVRMAVKKIDLSRAHVQSISLQGWQQ